MKVLLVNKLFFIRGGAETVYLQECDMLRQVGVRVINFSTQHENNFPLDYTDYFVSNVSYHKVDNLLDGIRTAVNFAHNSQAYKKMPAFLRKERPDVVRFHNIYRQLIPASIKVVHSFGYKAMLTAHNYKIMCPVYSMLRGGKVCDSCITGTIFDASRYRYQEGSTSKGLLLSLEAT